MKRLAESSSAIGVWASIGLDLLLDLPRRPRLDLSFLGPDQHRSAYCRSPIAYRQLRAASAGHWFLSCCQFGVGLGLVRLGSGAAQLSKVP